MDTLFKHILDLVNAKSEPNELTPDEKDILAAGYTDFILRSIHKYVQGRRAHGNISLFDSRRNMIHEMENELIDHTHYMLAHKLDVFRGVARKNASLIAMLIEDRKQSQ